MKFGNKIFQQFLLFPPDIKDTCVICSSKVQDGTGYIFTLDFLFLLTPNHYWFTFHANINDSFTLRKPQLWINSVDHKANSWTERKYNWVSRPLFFRRNRHAPTFAVVVLLSTMFYSVTFFLMGQIALPVTKKLWACTASSSENIFYKCTLIITRERYN